MDKKKQDVSTKRGCVPSSELEEIKGIASSWTQEQTREPTVLYIIIAPGLPVPDPIECHENIASCWDTGASLVTWLYY